ncbi:MAG: hypothetical protein CK425_02870 [Parachlamydia sp.]|nr:MAG: hypothetical protein CK425_02870 [Parachlamydia sp.]
MSLGIKTPPNSSILFESESERNTLLAKIINWEGRKICSLSCLHEILKVVYDTHLLLRETLKFGYINLEIIVTGALTNRSSSLQANYFKNGKELLLKLLRLSIRVVQSTTNFFGHLAGFLVHPSIGKWVEKQTNYLDRFKFLNVPDNLDNLFKKRTFADYSGDSFANASQTKKPPTARPSQPSQAAPPPIVFDKDNPDFYEPVFSNPLDYYRVLGLPPSKRTPAAIKKRWHELSRKIHPDKNKNDAQAGEKFGMLTDAKDALLAGKKPPRMPTYVPEPAAPQPVSDIEIPSIELPEVVFMLKAEDTLARILSSRETSKFPLDVIQQKCEQLSEVVKKYQNDPEKVTQAALKRLSLLEKAANAYLKLSKDFVLSGSLQILAKMDEASARALINKLQTLGKEILPFILSSSPEETSEQLNKEPMKIIKSILGLRYFDKMNALYLLLVRSGYEKKKGYSSYLKIEEYRKNIAPHFYAFYNMRKDTINYLIPKFTLTRKTEPLTSVQINAVKNYKYMVNGLDEIFFSLFPKNS